MSVVANEATQPSVVPRHVRHALDYIRANFREKITLADLATAAGTSQRALLQQFRRFVGAPPIAHLLRMRLTEARAELQRCDPSASISDVALRCGLTHVGRFAAEYRKAFGELPSATLRRARVRPLNGITAPFVFRQRPSLLILPLRTETLAERRIAQELMEQVAAALGGARVASISFADPTVSVSRQTAWSPNGSAVAQYCLRGRLVQRGDRIRITLWLMDGEGRHVWGDSYDSAAADLFDLLRRVQDGVLLGIVPGITGAEIERARGKDPRALAARDMLMQVFPVLLKVDSESSRQVSAVASRAMELDPDDALPFAVGAYCQARLFNDIRTVADPARRDAAFQLSRRAEALDGGDPLVVTARGAVASLLGLRPDAEALAERALAMDPTSAWAHERAGVLLWTEKPDAAIACFNRAIQLHGPFVARENCFHGIARAHETAGRIHEAARWIRRALAENPKADAFHLCAITYEMTLGHHAEAQRLAAELCRVHPDVRVSRRMDEWPETCVDHLLRAGVPF